jgi:hypothetical protein
MMKVSSVDSLQVPGNPLDPKMMEGCMQKLCLASQSSFLEAPSRKLAANFEL